MAKRAARPADSNDLCLELAAGNDRVARLMPSAADERPPMATGGVAAILRLTIGPMLVYAAIASAAAGILGIVE